MEKSMYSDKLTNSLLKYFLEMCQTFFTQRALKGKFGTWALEEHLGTLASTRGTLFSRLNQRLMFCSSAFTSE